jgi:hypothetical protein
MAPFRALLHPGGLFFFLLAPAEARQEERTAQTHFPLPLPRMRATMSVTFSYFRFSVTISSYHFPLPLPLPQLPRQHGSCYTCHPAIDLNVTDKLHSTVQNGGCLASLVFHAAGFF